MDEEIKNKLNETLIGMIDDLSKTKDFVIEQAPDVIQQLLTWRFTISIIECCSLLILMPILAYLCYRTINCKYWDSGKEWPAFFVFFCGAGFVFCFFCLFLTYEWLKIWLAPKLFLLEYAKDFF